MKARISELRLKGPYRYFWLMHVTGVDLSQHCLRCLKGNRDKRVTNSTTEIRDMEMPDAPYHYLCGVSNDFSWDKNLHLAFREKDGSVIDIDTELWRVRVENAEEIPITEESIDWGLPHAHDPRYNTCRNWRFANWAYSQLFETIKR